MKSNIPRGGSPGSVTPRAEDSVSQFWVDCAILLSLAFAPCVIAAEDVSVSAKSPAAGGQATSNHEGETPLTAGYDKGTANGFFIRSKDGEFGLNIGAYTQARYDINWRDAAVGEDDVEQGFSLNRTRIFLTGQFTPTFDYHFRFNIDEDSNFDLLIAFLQYNIGNKWTLRAGRQFIAMSREDWMWAEDTLTTEFSAHDATFALGTAVGFQANYQAQRTRFWLSLNDGSAGAKNEFPNADTSDVALTGRWEHQIAGQDWSMWDDQVGRRGRARGILLGLASGYQAQDDTSGFDQGAQLNADISFNGSGYQAMIAGSWTWQEPVAAESYSNYGLLVQGGFFIAEHWQIYTQYNFIAPGDQQGSPTCSPPLCELQPFNSITAGVSYFPFLWTNRWKFSAEAAHLFEALNETIVQPSGSLGWLASDASGQTYLRVQAQFGF